MRLWDSVLHYVHLLSFQVLDDFKKWDFEGKSFWLYFFAWKFRSSVRLLLWEPGMDFHPVVLMNGVGSERQLFFGSYIVSVRQALHFSFRLNGSRRHPGIWLMGKVFATPPEQNLLYLITPRFQLWEMKAGGSFSVKFPWLVQFHLLTSPQSTVSNFSSFQLCCLAMAMVKNFPH